MFFDGNTSLENYDSDTECTDVEEIHPIPMTAQNFDLKQPKREEALAMDVTTSDVTASSIRTVFRPELDTAKARNHNTGFNRIKHVKNEEPTLKSEASEGSENIETSPVSEVPTSSLAQNIAVARSERGGSVRSLKVEKRPTRKRTPHNRTLGPSMTRNAIDYRQRKKVQEQYREHLATLIDADIVEQVEEEGWITPDGRLYKASVRMLERVKNERELRTIYAADVKIETAVIPTPELEMTRRRLAEAEGTIRHFKSSLGALLRPYS